MQEICQVISWGMSQVQGADAPATQGVSDPGEAKHEPSTSHLAAILSPGFALSCAFLHPSQLPFLPKDGIRVCLFSRSG